MAIEAFVYRDGGAAYMVTKHGVTAGTSRRLTRVEQDHPCTYCLTDDGASQKCTCIGYCGVIICAGDDPL